MKIFLMKILITQINLRNEIFFLKGGDDAVQAHTSKPVPYNCDAYLAI